MNKGTVMGISTTQFRENFVVTEVCEISTC